MNRGSGILYRRSWFNHAWTWIWPEPQLNTNAKNGIDNGPASQFFAGTTFNSQGFKKLRGCMCGAPKDGVGMLRNGPHANTMELYFFLYLVPFVVFCLIFCHSKDPHFRFCVTLLLFIQCYYYRNYHHCYLCLYMDSTFPPT